MFVQIPQTLYSGFGVPALQTASGWSELSAAQNFTQDDVEMNRLWYAHTAATNANGFKGHDSFRFTLSDLQNESPAQSFFISVHTVQKGQRSRYDAYTVNLKACVELIY